LVGIRYPVSGIRSSVSAARYGQEGPMASPLRITAHVDGGSRGNPGPAAAGVVLTDEADSAAVFEGGFYLGRATNNVAEYRGLLEALRAARRLAAREVTVVSDSELLVRQMNGQYRVRNEALQPLHAEAAELAATFTRCTFRHVRREHNRRADELVNEALDARGNVEDAAGAAPARRAQSAPSPPPHKPPPTHGLNRIAVRAGKPFIRDTDITAGEVAQLLVDGMSDAKVLEEYAELDDEDLRQCLLYAGRIVAGAAAAGH